MQISQTPSLKPVLEIVFDKYGKKLRNFDPTVYKDFQQIMKLDDYSLTEEFHNFMDRHEERIEFWHPVASEILYELSRNTNQ